MHYKFFDSDIRILFEFLLEHEDIQLIQISWTFYQHILVQASFAGPLPLPICKCDSKIAKFLRRSE